MAERIILTKIPGKGYLASRTFEGAPPTTDREEWRSKLNLPEDSNGPLGGMAILYQLAPDATKIISTQITFPLPMDTSKSYKAPFTELTRNRRLLLPGEEATLDRRTTTTIHPDRTRTRTRSREVTIRRPTQ